MVDVTSKYLLMTAAQVASAAVADPARWYVPIRDHERLLAWLVGIQATGPLGRLIHALLALRGTDIHEAVRPGRGLRLPHAGIGVVVHQDTRIGRNVTIYSNVTIGRADPWRAYPRPFGGIDICDEAILCSGAAVLGHGAEPLVVAEGTVVGANSVLTESTGPWEIWAGAPARKVGERER